MKLIVVYEIEILISDTKFYNNRIQSENIGQKNKIDFLKFHNDLLYDFCVYLFRKSEGCQPHLFFYCVIVEKRSSFPKFIFYIFINKVFMRKYLIKIINF